MTLQITEIIRRSEQGVTHPYICRADDNEIYFVKGRGAGRRSQICEWISGHLAQQFALPIADFSLVEVPNALLAGKQGWLSDLGTGISFGSRLHPSVQEFSISHVALVPIDIQRDILVFDWWLHNADRCLSDKGGNPNLCWDQPQDTLLLIDHNQAFDPDFSASSFLESHVFRSAWQTIDMIDRTNYNDRFTQAITALSAALATIPEDWWYIDDEHTVPTDLNIAMIKQLLGRYTSPDFWNVTP